MIVADTGDFIYNANGSIKTLKSNTEILVNSQLLRNFQHYSITPPLHYYYQNIIDIQNERLPLP